MAKSKNAHKNGHSNGSIKAQTAEIKPIAYNAIRPQLRRAKMKAFLKILAASLNVTRAAKAVGLARITAYTWRKEDEEFAAGWDDAVHTAIDRVEHTVLNLATGKYTKMVVSAGKHLGDEQIFDMKASELLLRARRPEVYRERSSLSITGANGGPIKIERKERREVLILVADAARLLAETGVGDLAGLAGQSLGTTLALAEASGLPEPPA